MKAFFKILVLVALMFTVALLPDLSSKKDALFAVNIASDTNEAHVAQDVNNAGNFAMKGFAFLILLSTTGWIIRKEIKKTNVKKEITE